MGYSIQKIDLRGKILEIGLLIGGDIKMELRVTRYQIMERVSILTDLLSMDALF